MDQNTILIREGDGYHPNPVRVNDRNTMVERIKAEAITKLNQSNQNEVLVKANENKEIGLFKMQSANQWMHDASKRPVPKMLFGGLWHEGELGILFADTNQGKSIQAVQIADSISRGVPIEGFQMEADKQPVIYLDFELTDKQFENRYSKDYTEHYNFDEGFLRVELNPNFEIPQGYNGFEEYLIVALEEVIRESNSKVIVVDNLTYLRTENEQAKEAGSLMKQLKNLKEKYGLSMLILAHTPKRNLQKALDVNDLQGSKMIANFCDSIWAIGNSSQESDLRYIKQIKARATAKQYGEDNVIICRIEKRSNFLGFTHIGYGREWEHLKVDTDSDRQERIQDAKAMKEQGRTNVEIADHFGVSEGAVRKWIRIE